MTDQPPAGPTRRLVDGLDRLSPAAGAEARRVRDRLAERSLKHRVEVLEREVDELRQLSRRLADTLDVVGELLVPALDRDDARVREALDRLA